MLEEEREYYKWKGRRGEAPTPHYNNCNIYQWHCNIPENL
jgi:hypothetical protein